MNGLTGDAKQNGHPRQLQIQYGRKRIEFELRYSERRTLAIDVHPDLSVVATAPTDADDEAVEKKIRKRAAWIVQQQRFFQNYLPTLPPRRYVSGEAHRYLGRQYRLRVRRAKTESIKMARGQINVTVRHDSADGTVKRLVRSWYRERAEIVLDELFHEVATQAERHAIETESFEVRRMKNRWGSCTTSGRVLLNPDLVIAPKPCIEYVIAHELCHLQELNHSPAFYRLLKKLMPDWEKRRERLNDCVVEA